MSRHEPNEFVEPFLRFRLTKPESWNWLPPAWSPIAQIKNSGVSDLDWVALSHKPFCCAMGTHPSNRHAYPTLQVTVRPLIRPADAKRERLLLQLVEFMSEQHENFDVLDQSLSVRVGGHPTSLLRARFDLHSVVDDEPVEFAVLSRSYTVFSTTRAFVVGLSSSEDPNYYDEHDFSAILSSISIDA
jgi:hypothetical protein